MKGQLIGWLGFILTVLKPGFGVVVAYLVFMRLSQAAAVGIFCIALVDIFDGVLFRASALATNSRLGRIRRILDAVGDRLVVQIVSLALVFWGGLPLGFYLLATSTELVKAAIVGYSQFTRQPIREPNMPARVALALVGVMAIAWLILGFNATLITAGALSVCTIIASHRYYKTIATAS